VSSRTVTVVFTDLVGSTELSSRLDAATADALRDAHFGALRAEVVALGGTVVKNLGDGLMMVFDSPKAAISSAVAMQQAVEIGNRRAVERLAMRVGIATGEATESDGDFFGDPVVEAARLCAVAKGGQILATDVARAVAGRHVSAELVPVGELALKGLPGPVAAVEVRWEPAVEPAGAIPLPVRLASGEGGLAFVGRVAELAVLGDALKAATAQGQRCVLVSGEPGIGKTTLAAEFARAAHHDGAVVLYGRCDEDLGIPYQPWAEALTHLVDRAEPGLLDDVLAAHGADLARLSPALARLGGAGGGGSADPETARYLLFRAVLRVVQAAGAVDPVVLVLDDLQWADVPTLQLLRHVIGSDEPLSALLVGTFRESDVGPGHPLADLLASLHRESSVARITLRGLGDVELLALLEAAAGQALDEPGLALRDALSRETDGNPFFVGELLRHLAESGVIYHDGEGRWAATADLRQQGLPVSVREVIGRRVARLGDEATRALSVAAVIGRDFELGVLASACESDEAALLDVLEAAAAATLVINVAGERYTFVHALVEHALYDALTPARRVRAHRRVAEAIEEACGADTTARVSELAYHYAQATVPQDASKAIAYARAAAERALAQLAPDEALRWYSQALGLLDQQPDDARLRGVLLVGIGDAQRQTGDPAFRDTLLEAGRLAQRVGDNDTLAAAVLANNRGWNSANLDVDAERVAMIEAALAGIGDSDSTRRARLLSLLAQERTFGSDYPGRRAVADEALGLARRLGDPVTLLDVLVRRIAPIWVPETLAERHANTAEAQALAAQLGDPIGRFWSADYRSVSAIESADLAEYTRCVQEEQALAAETGQPILRWTWLLNETSRVLLAGDAERAEELTNECLQLGFDTGQPDTILNYGTLLVAVRWHQGRLGELVDLVAAAAAESPGEPAVRAVLAGAYAEAGREEEARELLGAEAAVNFAHPHDLVLVTNLAVWAEVAARLGDRAAAEMLYPQLAPWADQVMYRNGAVAHYLGVLAAMLGRYGAAEAHFADAQAIHEQLEAPFHLARTHLEWGQILLVQDPKAAGSARPHLETAQDLARRHGCALVERHATELLSHL
jgi:class 3 adenylate cyclase